MTFAVGRETMVYVNGAADTTLRWGGLQTLAGGSISQITGNQFRVDWNTGEFITVANFNDQWLDWTVALGPDAAPGSVRGLLGSHTGRVNDFQLPDGTVLPQPLSEEQMLGLYADAWRVSPGQSLLDDSTDAVHAQLAQAMATGLDPAGAVSGPVVTTEDTTQLAVGVLLTTPQHA